MLDPNILISLKSLLFLLSINIYYFISCSFKFIFFTSFYIFLYKLKIIQHKYKTKSLWKLTLGLPSLYYLNIWYNCQIVNKFLASLPGLCSSYLVAIHFQFVIINSFILYFTILNLFIIFFFFIFFIL